MRSPEELAEKLVRQWHSADTREERLTSTDAWPLTLPIGKPAARQLNDDLDRVRAHIHAWRAVTIGTVAWEAISYRSASSPVEVPLHWTLHRPSEWIDSAQNATVRDEYQTLQQLCAETGERYHRLWIRRRHLWREKPVTEVIQAARLADLLEPDCAQGRPLRALGLAGIDSKFFEKHNNLVIQLLDTRFEGRVSEIGLETFLGAAREGEHWLLLADLDGGLLPFARQRVRATELASMANLPGTHLILVENERSLHQLPPAAGCLAILGAGLDLSWLSAPWLRSKKVAYWGDIDTWGLTMLGAARKQIPHLVPLLMDHATFSAYAPAHAVPEPSPAPPDAGGHLTPEENELMTHLRSTPIGRLEQEFLPREHVHRIFQTWHANESCDTTTAG